MKRWIKSQREEQHDNISPIETPFFSQAQKTKATQTKHEWQTDTLAAAATNQQIEGDDASALAMTATVRPSRVSRARYTSPMPPEPKTLSRTYRPASSVPACTRDLRSDRGYLPALRARVDGF